MRVLAAGADGFIGSDLVAVIAAAGHEVGGGTLATRDIEDDR